MLDPLQPSTWSVEMAAGGPPLAFAEAVARTPSFLGTLGSPLVSVAQDADGQHRFIRLSDAMTGKTLALLSEAEAKALDAQLLYARPGPLPRCAAPTEALATLPSSETDFSHLVRDDFAPHDGYTNYSVVPWLCLGPTQRVLLSDERTLTCGHPSERIMEHVSLVVNCHEDSCDWGKYKLGQAVPGGPKVITEALHKWYSFGGASTADKNDAIQRAIWAHLEQGGSVAVHCLAGIHRAACIVACQFLFRHYVLGHKHVPNEVDDIYRKLQSVRPHVSPAYLHILKEYEAHVRGLPPRSANGFGGLFHLACARQ